MRRRCLQASLIGMLAAGMAGCGAPSSAPTGELPSREAVVPPSGIPWVQLPREADAADLLEPRHPGSASRALPGLGDDQENVRFRRVLVGNVSYYVPYCAPGTDATYVPYYTTYDPESYYVTAFSAPDAGARAILVRYGRREGGGSR